jgi:hypothetical protein
MLSTDQAGDVRAAELCCKYGGCAVATQKHGRKTLREHVDAALVLEDDSQQHRVRLQRKG